MTKIESKLNKVFNIFDKESIMPYTIRDCIKKMEEDGNNTCVLKFYNINKANIAKCDITFVNTDEEYENSFTTRGLRIVIDKNENEQFKIAALYVMNGNVYFINILNSFKKNDLPNINQYKYNYLSMKTTSKAGMVYGVSVAIKKIIDSIEKAIKNDEMEVAFHVDKKEEVTA